MPAARLPNGKLIDFGAPEAARLPHVQQNQYGVIGRKEPLAAGENRQIIRAQNLPSPGLQTVVVSYDFINAIDTAQVNQLTVPLLVDMRFGVGGVQLNAQFDLAEGVRFVIPAEGIELNVSYPAVGGGVYQPPVMVNAGVIFGGAGASNTTYGALRRSYLIEALGAGATTAAVRVRAFASVAAVYSSVPGAPIVFRQLNGQGGNIQNESFGTTTPILGGMPYWQVTNPLAVAVDIRVAFVLAL